MAANAQRLTASLSVSMNLKLILWVVAGLALGLLVGGYYDISHNS